ncbi:uncharacterized protein [Dendrobates tinctorius]|uniref:uncharacterized protein n=1 Tax=Dendrobates tinctorius TaxID=92724 RepID=UPI003CC93F2B
MHTNAAFFSSILMRMQEKNAAFLRVCMRFLCVCVFLQILEKPHKKEKTTIQQHTRPMGLHCGCGMLIYIHPVYSILHICLILLVTMDLRWKSFHFNLDLDIAMAQAYAVACHEQRKRERQRRRRRLWIHPIVELRESRGAYHTLYSELRANPEKFTDYIRMSHESFMDLLARVQQSIRRQDTQLRRAIPPEERLLVTLRFLATGETLSSLHFQYRIGISTLSGIVADTCRALWNVLCPEFMPLPTAEKWMEIADKFWTVCNFPNCLGAVDGKHIRIIKPQRTGSEYYNYKKYFSIVLIAIADAGCMFVAVDIGAFGRGNDSQAFKNSDMGRRLYGNQFNFPMPRPLPHTEAPPLPFVMVGDEAFQMCGNLLKPYSSRDLDHTKKIFNYRLTRARRTVECAFGILVSRWRILGTAINLKLETVDEVVKACVVLHNFVMAKEHPTFELDDDAPNPLPEFTQHTLRSSVEVGQMRDKFAAYFISDVGRVHWQDEMV